MRARANRVGRTQHEAWSGHVVIAMREVLWQS
jgi:hypothetical protein